MIKANQLCVDYVLSSGKRLRALENLTWKASKGQITCVVGPSGCGKSTLLRAIAGLQPLTGGDLDVSLPNERSIEDVSMTFQSATLLPWLTIMENALLPFRIAKKQISLVIQDRLTMLFEMVGLSHFAGAYPHELSGGMRMRAALVRAFITSPHLVLMDEPFAALDEMTRDRLCLEVEKIWLLTKNTIIYVTHNLSEAILLSDKVTLMSPRPGRVTDEVGICFERPRSYATRSSNEFSHKLNRIRRSLSNGDSSYANGAIL